MVEFNFEKYFSGIKPKKITSPTAPSKKQSPKISDPEKNKPRKNRFNVKKKNWRKDVISFEIFILIIFIFLPVILYFTDKVTFNF